MKDRVTLYIATHNITGKKYFGKTCYCFTEIDLQKNYHGSGKYWRGHLNKHGDDVTMEIYRICSLNESDEDYVEPIALKFSEENDIVKSEEWLNMMYEDGLGGWPSGKNNPTYFLTPEQNKKKGNWVFCSNYDDVIKKRSENALGENNPMYGKNYQCSGLIKRGELLKGKTYEEIFGEERAKELKNNLSISQSGKTHNLAVVKCPHSCLIGKGPNMTRYHFDNCYLNCENKDLRKEIYVCYKCSKQVQNIGNLNRWHNKNCKNGKINERDSKNL